MIRNYLKIASRTIAKKKFFSLLNITGLALGITAAVFIWQYVEFERSYDNFHENGERIYRVHTRFHTPAGQDDADAMNAAPVGPALKNEYPEVESYVRITPEYDRMILKLEDKQFEECKLYYVDSNFSEIFNYPFLHGDPNLALRDPFSIILTRSVAERYFGPEERWIENPVGQTIRANNLIDFKITGIIEDVPENTHFKFNGLISFVTFLTTNGDPSQQWEWNDFYTYIRLREGTNISAFQDKLDDFADRHLNAVGSEEYKVYYGLQSVNSIHLNSDLPYEMEANGDGRTVSFLLLIAILILIIAWANYINLATARAEERSQEVGIRKVIGADRKSLIGQFLTESFLVNLLALILALALIILFQPVMDALVGKQVATIFNTPSRLIPTLLIVLIGGTIVSGLYPAFILSAHKPAKKLTASIKKGGQNWFQTVLVTMQYTCSIILIIITIIIFRQLNFMKNADLGFSLDKKIVVNAPAVYSDSTQTHLFQVFRDKLLRDPQILNVSASSAIPGKYYLDLDSRGGIRLASADENTGASFTSYRIDENYFDTYGLRIIAGKDFRTESAGDDRGLAINEKALEILGFSEPEDAIGRRIRFQRDDLLLPIVNVFENYHHKSLKHRYEPTILWNYIPNPLYYTIKYNTSSAGEINALVAKTKDVWTSVFSENPFQYFFFDDQYNAQYEADNRLGMIVGTFSLFAIIIACMGLFGLTAYMISLRTKEIGIRKVLGSGIREIVILLTKDFLRIVLIAVFIAIPLSIYFGTKWLDNFAYKSSLSWWIFALAGSTAVMIAILTVGFKSIQAALNNPVDSLRNE